MCTAYVVPTLVPTPIVEIVSSINLSTDSLLLGSLLVEVSRSLVLLLVRLVADS